MALSRFRPFLRPPTPARFSCDIDRWYITVGVAKGAEEILEVSITRTGQIAVLSKLSSVVIELKMKESTSVPFSNLCWNNCNPLQLS